MIGRKSSGKTAMKSIIFANYHTKETMRLTQNTEMQTCNVNLLGCLQLLFLDCKTYDFFVSEALNPLLEQVVKNVAVMIYVLDVSNKNLEVGCLEA